jgi:large subunit ribosomal protein L19
MKRKDDKRALWNVESRIEQSSRNFSVSPRKLPRHHLIYITTMPPLRPQSRPIGPLKLLLRRTRQVKSVQRSLSTVPTSPHTSQGPPPNPRSSPVSRPSTVPSNLRASQIMSKIPSPVALQQSEKPLESPTKIKIHPPPSSVAKKFPTPVAAFTASQISLHDPTGARTALISRDSPTRLRQGDIVLIRLRDAPDISGHLIEIRRKGIDSSILLRNELTRVGVEMCYKIYSPLLEGVEMVERMQKKPRRARLTYLRKPKHDRGSTLGVVGAYLRRKRALMEGIQGRGSGQSSGKGKGQRVKGKK